MLAYTAPEITYTKHGRILSIIAYASLLFGVLAVLFTMRSLWSIPLIILCFLCAGIGAISPTHGYVARTGWLTFTFLFNILFGSLFYVGQSQDQVTRLQQQQLVFVNQHLLISYQNAILSRQLTLLSAHQQFLSLQPALSDGYKKSLQIWSQHVQYTTDELKEIKSHLSSLNDFRAYTTYGLQQDAWQLPNSASVQKNDDILASNAKEVQAIQEWILTVYQPQIIQNNTLLPDSEKIAYQPPPQQQSCPSSYQCALQPWQQSFRAGWQRTILQPLSETWQFWSALFLGLLVTFIVLPQIIRPSRTLTYRILSSRLLSSYPPTSLPSMHLSTLPSSATLLQIGLRRSWLPMPLRKDFQRDYLLFDFTSAATILDMYMEIDGVISSTFFTAPATNAENVPELTRGPQPGTILFRPKKAISVPQIKRRYPIQLFIAIEQPVTTITATAALPDLDRFEQTCSIPLLHALLNTLNFLSLILLYCLSSIPLIGCSADFFDSLNWNHPILFSTFFGLLVWGLVTWLVLKSITLILKKFLIRPQRIASLDELPPVFTGEESLSL